jgi:Ca2+-binding EF-hand superfamily protein
MLRAIATAGALLFCLASTLTPAELPDSAGTPESIRDLVYWGPGGPIRIRLHLYIAARPADTVWSAAVSALFTFCDRNGDGVLDAAEQAPFVEPRRGRDQQIVPDDSSGIPALRLTFEQRNAKVTRAMFETALRDAGFGPVVLTVALAQSNSQRLSTALFRRLDRDGDGKLSTEELHAARERLAFFDANEDELVSVAELLGRVETNALRPVAIERSSTPDSTNPSSDLLMLPGESGAAIEQIVSSRGDARSKTIRRAEFGSDDKAFAALDRNGDGRLDASELLAWLRQPPDLDIRVSDGLFTLPAKPDGGRLHIQTQAIGSIEASSARVSFRFDQPATDAQREPIPNGRIDRIRAEMKRLADAKGFVERKKLPVQPRRLDSFDMLAFFDLADRNADGKLETAEVEAALKVLAPLLDGCRTTITIRDQGAGLFELMDRNGDGQLSPREMVDAVQVLKHYADSTGMVSPGGLPRRFFVQSTVQPIPVIYFPGRAPTTRQSLRRPDVPTWFYDMDRNGDGDVSLREFLGPIELFHKLDKDGDGLISPDEARGR